MSWRQNGLAIELAAPVNNFVIPNMVPKQVPSNVYFY